MAEAATAVGRDGNNEDLGADNENVNGITDVAAEPDVEEVGVWRISETMSGADLIQLMKKYSQKYPASAFPDAVLSSYNPEYSASFLFDAIRDGEWLSFVYEAVDSDIGKMLVKQAFQKFFSHCGLNLGGGAAVKSAKKGRQPFEAATGSERMRQAEAPEKKMAFSSAQCISRQTGDKKWKTDHTLVFHLPPSGSLQKHHRQFKDNPTSTLAAMGLELVGQETKGMRGKVKGKITWCSSVVHYKVKVSAAYLEKFLVGKLADDKGYKRPDTVNDALTWQVFWALVAKQLTEASKPTSAERIKRVAAKKGNTIPVLEGMKAEELKQAREACKRDMDVITGRMSADVASASSAESTSSVSAGYAREVTEVKGKLDLVEKAIEQRYKLTLDSRRVFDVKAAGLRHAALQKRKARSATTTAGAASEVEKFTTGAIKDSAAQPLKKGSLRAALSRAEGPAKPSPSAEKDEFGDLIHSDDDDEEEEEDGDEEEEEEGEEEAEEEEEEEEPTRPHKRRNVHPTKRRKIALLSDDTDDGARREAGGGERRSPEEEEEEGEVREDRAETIHSAQMGGVASSSGARGVSSTSCGRIEGRTDWKSLQ
jgi:hypothetical protein